MFGMGGSEIIVILIVALLFLGPDKLPQAAKSLSKGIRDIKKQSRVLQNQIESDEQIGGAIRDLKSALRGEELPSQKAKIRPRPKKELAPGELPGGNSILGEPPAPALEELKAAEATGEAADHVVVEATGASASEPDPDARPAITLPATAGESDSDHPEPDDAAELAAMIKPASGTVAKGS
jgi:sec-independent protein translocase protein TatB